MIEEEIPAAIREVWPSLRLLFERESMKLARISADGEDYSTVGIYVTANEKLLERIDSIMSVPPTSTTPKTKAARLGIKPKEQKS